MVTKELLTKFLAGACSPDELMLLRDYFAHGNIGELNRILDEDWEKTDNLASSRDIESQKRRIFLRLSEEIGLNHPGLIPDYQPLPGSRGRSWVWSAAAVVGFCILGFGGFMLRKSDLKPGGELAPRISEIEQRNQSESSMTIYLSDGSKVELEPGSKISYPREFSTGNRVVRLEGQAFFDVAKDSLSPFLVNTKSLNVKVLGTSFNVSSFENGPAEVSVVTGKVEVYVSEKEETVILQPNERAVQSGHGARLAKMLVEEPAVIKREVLERIFDFDETPVGEVFKALEKAYEIHIRFDPDMVKHCTLRAKLDAQPLFVKMDMICASLGLTYEVVGTDIIVNGEGCIVDVN